MANEKISSVKLSDGSRWSFFDKEGVHWKFIDGRGFILITGDPVVDGEILNKNLYIVECNDQDIENLLTYKDGMIKTRDVKYIYRDIGGDNNEVDAEGTLSIKTPKALAPTPTSQTNN